MEKNFNLIEARKKSGLSQAQLAEKIDAQQPYIAKLEKGEPFSDEQAEKIAKILGVSPDIISSKNITNNIETPIGSITKTSNTVTRSKSLIPFYNADFMAGKSDVFYDDGSTHPDYYMDVPEFYGCVAFRAYGESMEPIIKSGNVLFGLKMDDWQSSLEYGQIYGITLKDGRRVLKYIRRASDHKNMFLLKSANKDFDEYEEFKSKIKNIWLIQGWLDKRA